MGHPEEDDRARAFAFAFPLGDALGVAFCPLGPRLKDRGRIGTKRRARTTPYLPMRSTDVSPRTVRERMNGIAREGLENACALGA